MLNKIKKNSKKGALMMIGSGELMIFKRVKKGSKVMIGSGEHSQFVEAELTLEEARKRLNAKERKFIGLDKDIIIENVKAKVLSRKKKY